MQAFASPECLGILKVGTHLKCRNDQKVNVHLARRRVGLKPPDEVIRLERGAG